MSNSYEKKLADLNVELEAATSPTIRTLIEKSICSTNFAAHKCIELVECCKRLPQIIQNASDDLDRENERSLNDLEILIEGSNSLNEIENLDESHKRANSELTEFCIKQTEVSIKVRNSNHEQNLNVIKMGAKELPKLLFDRIYKLDFSDINSDAIKELINYGFGMTPIAPVVGAASAIVGIKNSKKNKSSDANSYILGFENYNLSIECWCSAVDATIHMIESLEVNSYSELNKAFKSDS
ncbi:hypothetical protein NB550_21050 [Vibrio parahaemolyticus]|uniref:hypothetical protein n=1 Tax=Vibrio parahaemolyticus TaxID=670 RepID=UPI00046E8BED|nr:hypothetical protein [Vibrio parahaemolyticus]EKH9213259.1 hypothetical protein [Vibrio parahaemolyticus]MBY4655333.1 hypothetical protein [Vibrio parahaemolyticus]MCR9767820.1 hypothetical protein [Vibrio parahaemolyticus]MCR9890782.1 hypothetical protein [Vibrio parahaemolyticus]MCR9919977.1 hypothetical protein [Vibrio parahaemolyticus]